MDEEVSNTRRSVRSSTRAQTFATIAFDLGALTDGDSPPPPNHAPPRRRAGAPQRSPSPPMLEEQPIKKKGRPAKRQPQKQQDALPDIPPEEEGSLYHMVLQGKASLPAIVYDWMENYKNNKEDALRELMQFFISASGCKGKITRDMQTQMEHATIIRKMTELFDEESGEYPLIMAGVVYKKFRNGFCDFVQTLVKQCQYSILYDQYMMDNVISLLLGLSDSQVRAFRHTATLAGMKLMTALVDVALTVSVNLDNTTRQYEAERQKSKEKRASDRMDTLLQRLQELEENMDEIKNMLNYMFKSVFMHRYRDTLPEIRSICMQEIGVWMRKFHSMFLDDSYLKYIGWTLHDKIGEVRLKCLQSLLPLYEAEELKGKLELFTSKFRERIVNMALDKEPEVAVQAVKLVTAIYKYSRHALEDKDCEALYELVYSSHRAIAQAAGEFLNERFFSIDENAPIVTSRRGKKRSPHTPLLRDLVCFFIESELHEHGAYLVDSLIESHPMMKDWECMTDLLVEEPEEGEEPLDSKQEVSLIEIMVCCVRQAATGEPPVGRGVVRKVMSNKEQKQILEDRCKLTEHFIATIPALVSKYRNDPLKIANLLIIPQYFDLEMYTKLRQEKSLDAFLKLLPDIVEKHNRPEVLETCAKTLETFCNDEYAIYSKCNIARTAILDKIVVYLKEGLDAYISLVEGAEEPNEDEIYAVDSPLLKASILSTSHSFGHWDVWNQIFDLIKKIEENTLPLPETCMVYSIRFCYYGLLWDLENIEENPERGSARQEQVENLRARLHLYMGMMYKIVSSSQVVSYREEAYLSICDTLVIFSKQLISNPILAPLVYEAEPVLIGALNHFINHFVFMDPDDERLDDHARIEELHKRRNFLSSFCKLIVYNMFPSKSASDVFKNYLKFYDQYGDIVKMTLSKTRENNKVNSARTMVLSLSTAFTEAKALEGTRKQQNEAMTALKELAKRFALSFGLDAVKNREAVTALHREGILFAVTPLENPDDPTGTPPNIGFLEIVAEFTNKLLKQDKKIVLQYLDKRLGFGVPSSRNDEWQSLIVYRNGLIHGEGDGAPVPSKRAYHRKKNETDDEEDQDDYEDLDY
ncbi:cohesin subunit SA-1-like isoform X2 [Artemia franciscana]|uniref:SCD domain-containing protein n=1 Tax=Artemia franciscana TaxID=6661 RepID=A0AA88I2G2_ARTSF|nr:hypothetical protein QYM36_004306 [Artemia franciscana]KAK2720378.1 hypothetical protein QYM36_004306 [Artemia franciscana]KAK2720379.1 hypothetical protein QYM36_004306 [Artemia franciscana]KAK2720380.1 hypothetical protein QYM36_004306 [Artemia franciscana]KAK2720381.1 hypothetical protein QYM36_004306 [Artemia franciscana]